MAARIGQGWLGAAALWASTAGVVAGSDAMQFYRGSASTQFQNSQHTPWATTPHYRPAAVFIDGPTQQPKRIFFPPDPPPLDARINLDAGRARSPYVPEELSDFVAEPFYAPLSTWLTELDGGARKKFRPRVDAYRKKRDELLQELRQTLAAISTAPADERFAALSALAQRQGPALRDLEQEGERLRAELARMASWYSLREWKLGRGRLKQRLPEHRVLEFELARAAAFYQEGLAPAQRRLLREAAMVMQDELFVEADEVAAVGTAPPPPPLVFFSPDLARILSADQFPGHVAALLEDYVATKDALRRELVALIIEQDKAVFASSRRGELEKRAPQFLPRLDELEAKAEAVRQAFAPTFDRMRPAAPRTLPPELEAKITKYEDGKRRIQRQFWPRQQALRARVRQEMQGEDPSEALAYYHEELRKEQQAYTHENRDEIFRLEHLLDEIQPALAEMEDALLLDTLAGPTDSFLVDFMRRHRESWSNYEYAIAVFEPGLSATQRRLLFGGALTGLDLPLPDPDRQPGALPFVLLKGRDE